MLENLSYRFPLFGQTQSLERFARAWSPDIVFNVADDTHSMSAYRLARTLSVPFAIHFQDLFAHSTFIPESQRPFTRMLSVLEDRYSFLQKNADEVFHTCAGMKAWFKEDARGEILYAIGGECSYKSARERRAWDSRKSKLVYAGNCYGSYGKMVLELARLLDGDPSISLEVFAMGNDWAAEDVEYFTERGVYLGYWPFERLREKFLSADGFLITMGFGEADRIFVQTSFPTKWCDYAPYGKPIFVWAPEYSSSARFVSETLAGELISESSAPSVIEAMARVFEDSEKRTKLGSAAMYIANHELSGQRLHELLRSRLLSAVSRQRPSSVN